MCGSIHTVSISRAVRSFPRRSIRYFKWYKKSHVCYAYLSDVPAGRITQQHMSEDSAFCSSRWFTRGWTLQELLAPEYVVFFDKDWNDIGTKSYLYKTISSVTGIELAALTEHSDNLRNARFSIAQKMAWASRRTTTRIEDEAYCLMGIFDINMPYYTEKGKRLS
jgi:hypothetical protein